MTPPNGRKELFAVKAIQKKKVKDYATFVNEINILKVLVSARLSQLDAQLTLAVSVCIEPPSHNKAA